jgi:hypothetical protein
MRNVAGKTHPIAGVQRYQCTTLFKMSPTTHYPLPTTHYPLPTTHHPLFTARCSLQEPAAVPIRDRSPYPVHYPPVPLNSRTADIYPGKT